LGGGDGEIIVGPQRARLEKTDVVPGDRSQLEHAIARLRVSREDDPPESDTRTHLGTRPTKSWPSRFLDRFTADGRRS
jgi:hypothetical protein